jgi:hypothetical protein
MNCLTPRLFGPCKQDKHGECGKKLATYRCSCICHLASMENKASDLTAMPAPRLHQAPSGVCSLASLPYSSDSGFSESCR